MSEFWKTIEWVVDKMKIVGAACLAGMMFLTCADVVGRFFRHPILGSVELVGYMAILVVATALPYTDKIQGHVGVEILVRLLSDRKQSIVDLCTRILSLGLMGIITWRMIDYGLEMQQSGEVSMNLEFPEYVIIYLIAFCILILALVVLQELIAIIKKLKKQ